jgi:subtilisin-like proprotein convertase family protein
MIRYIFLLFSLTWVISIGCGSGDNLVEYDPPLVNLDDLFRGSPDPSKLAESKTDEIVPRRFLDLVSEQTPVKSQGMRGLCVAFAFTAMVEHAYTREGTHIGLDLSEQYLAWKVRQIAPDQREALTMNEAIGVHSSYGVPTESYWPYEKYPWTADDDPACGEVEKPMRCFTNGEPTPETRIARKYRGPQEAWLNTSPESLKAHMIEHRTTIAIGPRTFRHAWNLQPSSSTSEEYHRKGYVLTPTKEEEETSTNYSGHAILLVGWDDDLEVQRLDIRDQPLRDDSGNLLKDKGFFLFKNSWGTRNHGRGNSERAGYGWISYEYVQKHARAVGLMGLPDPKPAKEKYCLEGLDDDEDGKYDCDDPDCSEHLLCTSLPQLLYEDNESKEVIEYPDYYDEYFRTTIEVPEVQATIKGMTVSFDIEYPDPDKVYMVSYKLFDPAGDRVYLFRYYKIIDGNPSMQATFFVDKFDGRNPTGSWTLEIESASDEAPGTLKSWSLGFYTEGSSAEIECADSLDNDDDQKTDCDDSDCAEDQACISPIYEFQNNTVVDIPDDDPTGVTSEIVVDKSGRLLRAQVEVDITHSYRGDLEIRLIHPNGTDLQLQPKSNDSGDDIKQTYSVEGLTNSQINGTWRLKVIDHASADLGTLNRWVLRLETGGTPTEVCNDNIDNDGDNDTDCDDSECAGLPVCNPDLEVCDDGIDNDQDNDTDCEDSECADFPACSTTESALFFSEYVEGSSNNKALEVYNPTVESASLSECEVWLYFNGSTSPSVIQLESGSSLPPGGTFVICHSSSNATLASQCNQLSGSLTFNGDDALALVCRDQVMDVIGQIGLDPGYAWGVGDVATKDHTLRRDCGVSLGDLNGNDSFDPTTQWTGFASDTFDGLGNHCP